MTDRERQAAAAEFVLPLLLDLDELDWAALRPRISYGPPVAAEAPADSGAATVRIIGSDFFAEGVYGQPGSMPATPLRVFQGVPLLYGEGIANNAGGRLEIHADLVASSFFMLTRYEEWIGQGSLDEFGRLWGRESFPGRHGLLGSPLVERYGKILRELLTATGITVPPRRSRSVQVILTHDLDNHRLFGGLRTALGESLRLCLGRTTGNQCRWAWACALGLAADPYDTYPEIFRLARELAAALGPSHVRNIHFIMAGGASPHDGLYDLGRPEVAQTLAGIIQSGAEIGLHISYEAGGDASLIAGEKTRLERAIGRKVTRSRHHYLRFIHPEHAVQMVAAGITDDYTMCYPDMLGFRLGLARPVPAYDPGAFRRLGLTYHPTTMMDATLDNPAYLGAGEEEAFAQVRKYINEIATWEGELVLLWHNCRLMRNGSGYHSRLYPRVLEHIQRTYAHVAAQA